MTPRELAERILGELGPWDYAVFKDKLAIVESLLTAALEETRNHLIDTLALDDSPISKKMKANAYEECAKIAESLSNGWGDYEEDVAKKIRKRAKELK